jgi:uncharacterized membrane protein YhaH (DUF805 family)
MKRYFSFQGRLSRLPYLWGTLIIGLVALILKYAGDPLQSMINASFALGAFLTLCYLAIAILLIWLWLAINVQRMHDLSFSGWYVLTLLIPLVDVIVTLMLLIKKGDAGENKYGTVS